MLARDPLDTLGLKSDATADEIKQAYRDLVKVWHPDRFAADPRLRAKAEEHLKQINAAYGALQTGNYDREILSPPEKPEGSSYQAPPTSEPWFRSHRDRALRLSLYIASALLIAAMAGFAVQALHRHPPATAVVVPAAQQSAPASEHVSTIKTSHRVPPRTSDFNHSGRPDFQVWSLSQADTDRLQLACSRHPPGSEAYRDCVKSRLDALRPSTGAPEMTGLSSAERHAAQSACRTAKGSGSGSGYRRCLRQQVASLAAEPIRPDLSTLNDADRNAIDDACSGEGRRGAAEYDHCVLRFANTLAGAGHDPR